MFDQILSSHIDFSTKTHVKRFWVHFTDLLHDIINLCSIKSWLGPSDASVWKKKVLLNSYDDLSPHLWRDDLSAYNLDEDNLGKYNLYVDNLGSRISMKVIVMVDSRQPNTSIITTKPDQLITVTTQVGVTTQAGDNLISGWPLIAARLLWATGWSAPVVKLVVIGWRGHAWC